jgi:hypothetical protein
VIEHPDFSVVIKSTALLPTSWGWEIYRAGGTSPMDRSKIFFESMAEADRAGKRALFSFLGEFPD